MRPMALMHEASEANQAMPSMLYLRRPAARRIVSRLMLADVVLIQPFADLFYYLPIHRVSGIPFGYSSSIACIATSRGRLPAGFAFLPTAFLLACQAKLASQSYSHPQSICSRRYRSSNQSRGAAIHLVGCAPMGLHHEVRSSALSKVASMIEPHRFSKLT